MAPRNSARLAAANTRPRAGNAIATRTSNRLAGRPPTNAGLSSNAKVTKKPRKQPSRSNESNANRIASAVAENEQGPQPAGERRPPAEGSASEQRHQPAGERTPLAEVLDTEQRLQAANERIPSAEIHRDDIVPLQHYAGANADGSLQYPTRDEESRYPDRPMSDGYGDDGDQGGEHSGREVETPADGNVQPPTRRDDEELSYPDSPNQFDDFFNASAAIDLLRSRYLARTRPNISSGENDNEDSEEGQNEPDGDPDGLNANPAPPYDDHAEEQLLKVLFASVTTRRALGRKREELRECQQDIEDAKLMVRGHSTAFSQLVPNTEYDWIMHRAIQGQIAEWQTVENEKQDLETRINLHIEFLEERGTKYARPPQKFPHLSRESQQLRFLSQHDEFWELFAQNEATCRLLLDIDAKLRQSDADKNALDEAITRNCYRDLDLAVNGSASFSAAKEVVAFQDISQTPDLLSKHKELQASKLTAEKLQTEQWSQLLSLAENAFVKAKVLTLVKDTQEAQGEEGGRDGNEGGGSEVPEQKLPEPDAPLKSDSEVLKDGVRETLHAAKEACLKAREDFEDARKFSNEETAQLPQPATEDVVGAARVQKLARLTRALLVAEEAFNEAKKRAREVGITRPRDRTADFTDDPDDGYGASLLERAVVSSRDRIARVQGWTGLYLDPQDTQTLGVQTFLPLTLQRLRPVRLGEDSFDLTEADGRTRGRIDAMAAVTKNLRGNGEFPQADKDTPMIDRD